MYLFSYFSHFQRGIPERKCPTAFSDRIRSVSEKIQTKTNRMMGYIKNGPRTKMSRFFVRQRLPAKKSMCPFRFTSLIEVRPVKMPHQHFFHPKCHARRCDRLNTRCEAFYEKRIFDFHPLCLTISLNFHRSVLVFPIRHLNIHQSPLPHSIFVVIPSTSLKDTPIPNTSLDVYFNPHYLT